MSSGAELQAQGIKLFQRKDYEEAARVFQQAKTAYETEGKADIAAEMQVNIGLIHTSLGEHQQALDAMQAALPVFQALDDQKRIAMVLGNMGRVYAALNDREQAYVTYRSAADIFDAIGEKKLYGETMVAIGALQMKDGKLGAGAASYQAGLEEIDNLSASQKVIKGLSGVVSRLTGGQTKQD
ncbi:MAG: tetratricopeptide repeat protein [Chloroflexota bacterium]|nr:tetratricopeptide repeat protein [Chloroflexota bacterium]